MSNKTLNNVKKANNTDEFYTQYKDIENEISLYSKSFHNKSIYCNCDNPYYSNFVKYFIQNFNSLQLKSLTATSYKNITINLSDINSNKNKNNGNGCIFKINSVPEDLNDNSLFKFIDDNTEILSDSDGSYNSEYCEKILNDSDIIITNPPFSLFNDFVQFLMKNDKQFLIIGNFNSLLYANLFKFVKEGTLHIGKHFGEMTFRVSDESNFKKGTRFKIDNSGKKYKAIGYGMWLTNLAFDENILPNQLNLTSSYSSEKYLKYDNYDAIDVSKIKDIPKDYYGIMGVPITYFKYHNPEEFDIIGEANHGSDNEFDLFAPKINGKLLFKRLLIKRK